MKRAPAGPPLETLTVRLALHMCDRLFARMWHRLEVRNRCPLPETGPAILVCNHTSGLDPLLIQAASRRVIVWMMAKEYYEVAALTPIFRAIRAIPVARSGRDSTATRAALRALSEGRVLGIFPEGRIELRRELLPFQTGVTMMAIKTAVPVYPAYLDGSQRDLPMLRAFAGPQEATLRFGPAVEFDRSSTDKNTLEAGTEATREAVEALRRQYLAENPWHRLR